MCANFGIATPSPRLAPSAHATRGAAFEDSLSEPAPPDALDLALLALWWAGKGDWDKAHHVVQQDEGNPRCDHVHAFLHRQEGDAANAGYWYRRAGRPVPTEPLAAEWKAIAGRLLATRAPGS